VGSWLAIKKRMAEVEFEAIRPLLNISDVHVAATRSYLVDGETFRTIAKRHGWSHQAVADSVNGVWNTFQKYLEGQQLARSIASVPLPAGWERVELVAPSDLIAKFKKQVAKVSRELAKTK